MNGSLVHFVEMREGSMGSLKENVEGKLNGIERTLPKLVGLSICMTIVVSICLFILIFTIMSAVLLPISII